MKITVINGTERKGCTHAMKEIFLSAMGEGNSVREYWLPRDCPAFCTGCKACYFNNIEVCPHSQYTVPVWNDILAADLLVFTSPVYVFHVTAQMKALLDHYGTKWMAHSPEREMFGKQAVIITNAIGQGMGKTAADIKDSLDFWGVAHTHIIKLALFQAEWEKVDVRRKNNFQKNCMRISEKIQSRKKVKPRLKIKGLFYMMKTVQKMIDRAERRAGREPTTDWQHWKKNGWMDGKKPWSREIYE